MLLLQKLGNSQSPAERYLQLGATPDEWFHWDQMLGFGQDLLPVVANQNAKTSKDSSVRDIGKVPTRYNGRGEVSGILDWPNHRATDAEISHWSRQKDYGICIITREVRGIDVDVSDPMLAQEVEAFVVGYLGFSLPKRFRANSSRFLLAVRVVSDDPNYSKWVLNLRTPEEVQSGLKDQIEILMGGHQFIAAGTHKSGARIEWEGGLPIEIPSLTPAEFEMLVDRLQARFGKQPLNKNGGGTIRTKGANLDIYDPAAKFLEEKGLVLGQDRDGKLLVACPWVGEHTQGKDGDGSTGYFPAGSNGYLDGGFKCLHGHCEHRRTSDFYDAIGYEPPGTTADGFGEEETPTEPPKTAPEPRYKLLGSAALAAMPPLSWRVRGVLPAQGLAAIYGPSGSGKSFLAIDLCASIAMGRDWFGNRATAAPVTYLALEGEGGIRGRVRAWETHNGQGLPGGMNFILQPFDLTRKQDIDDLLAVLPTGGVTVVDTLNRAAPGLDENSSKDMGAILKSAKTIQAKTNGLVVLVHHSGKDASKGLRGHSSLFAAMDAVVEVERPAGGRSWRIAKSKDSEDGAVHSFDLQSVEVGHDEHGFVERSCVVTASGGVVSAPEAKLTASQALAMAAFDACCNTPAGVHRDDWRRGFYDRMGERTQEAKRKAFHRVVDELVSAGKLSQTGEFFARVELF